MATSNISTQAEKDNLISSPDWGGEARVPNRALWEIAAIAGDVEPKCRVPDDWLLKNKRPLLHGREVLREVLATWQARAKELPC